MDDSIIKIVFSLLILMGAVGSIVPILPGKPIAFAALLFAKILNYTQLNWGIIVLFGILTVVGIIFDYLVPVYITKKMGGTKYGIWGLIIGLIVGVVFSPFGFFSLIIAPFLGALIGELLHDRADNKKAVKAATGSIIGYFLTSGYGIVLCLVMLVVFLLK